MIFFAAFFTRHAIFFAVFIDFLLYFRVLSICCFMPALPVCVFAVSCVSSWAPSFVLNTQFLPVLPVHHLSDSKSTECVQANPCVKRA